MTRDKLECIRTEDKIYIRSDGAIVFDVRLERELDPDVLEQLLTIVGDNIGSGVDGDEIEWAGVADDCRKMGWLT